MPNVLARFPELSQITPEEKLALIDELWDSVRRSGEIAVPPSHLAELESRVEQVRLDPTLALSPREARALLRR